MTTNLKDRPVSMGVVFSTVQPYGFRDTVGGELVLIIGAKHLKVKVWQGILKFTEDTDFND